MATPHSGMGLRQPELVSWSSRPKGRHGIAQGRRTAELVDVPSESPGESFSRVRFWRWGLPAPTLQHVVRDGTGAFVARGDMAWPELGTIGEFDGKGKYGPELLRPGQTVQDAVLAEKRREERMRELGWQVVRWTWSDLSDRAQLVARLEAAFRRGRDLSRLTRPDRLTQADLTHGRPDRTHCRGSDGSLLPLGNFAPVVRGARLSKGSRV